MTDPGTPEKVDEALERGHKLNEPPPAREVSVSISIDRWGSSPGARKGGLVARVDLDDPEAMSKLRADIEAVLADAEG